MIEPAGQPNLRLHRKQHAPCHSIFSAGVAFRELHALLSELCYTKLPCAHPVSHDHVRNKRGP